MSASRRESVGRVTRRDVVCDTVRGTAGAIPYAIPQTTAKGPVLAMTDNEQLRATQIRLTEDQHRALQTEAERTGQSMSELVRIAVALYFEHARWLEERERES
jgi:hypothetical protein